MSVGYALVELGMFEEAEGRLRAALAEAERLGLALVRAGALHNLGLALARKGDLAEARALEDEAFRFFEEQGDRRMLGGTRQYLALIALAQGDLGRAETEARAAAEALEAAPAVRAYALATLAEALRRAGDPGALATARDAKAWLDGRGAETGEAFVRLVCAQIEDALGDPATAREQIRAARERLFERAEKIGSPTARESFLQRVPEHARTVALADEWLGGPWPTAIGPTSS